MFVVVYHARNYFSSWIIGYIVTLVCFYDKWTVCLELSNWHSLAVAHSAKSLRSANQKYPSIYCEKPSGGWGMIVSRQNTLRFLKFAKSAPVLILLKREQNIPKKEQNARHVFRIIFQQKGGSNNFN